MEEQNNAYQNPAPYQNPVAYQDTAPLSIGNYIIMMIVGAIPLVGLIVMIVWAFSGGTNKNKQNYARAILIMMAVCIVLSIIFGTALAAMVAQLGGIHQ